MIILLFYGLLCLSQFQLGTSTHDNSRGLTQKNLPGGRDLASESCPGAKNSTRARILWKMKMKLPNNSVNQIFTGENKKKTSWFFYLFRFLRVFSMDFFLVYGSMLWLCYHTCLTKIWGVALGLFIFDVFTMLWLSTPTFVQKVMIMLNLLSVYWIY